MLFQLINKSSSKIIFFELATQDYLLSIVDVKELVRFATIVTKTGLDISPSSKEVYIIPFWYEGKQPKGNVTTSNNSPEWYATTCISKGFFLQLDAVWKFDDGSCEAESKLTRQQQASLKTANAEWVEAHFIGFDVILTDLKNELPTQVKFVDLNYVKEATNHQRYKMEASNLAA